MSLSQRMKNIINFFHGFRKFIVMVLLVSVGVIFRISGHIDGQEMVELLRYTTVAFMGANTLEHIGKSVQEWIKNKTK